MLPESKFEKADNELKKVFLKYLKGSGDEKSVQEVIRQVAQLEPETKLNLTDLASKLNIKI